MSLRFQRATVLVANLDQALMFYRDVLGFELAYIVENEDSYSHDVFEIPAECRIRFAALNAPNQPRVMALTEVGPLEPLPPPRRAAVVLDVGNDFDAVVERAVKGGYRLFREERLVTHDGRTGRELGIVDADNNLAVIYNIANQSAT